MIFKINGVYKVEFDPKRGDLESQTKYYIAFEEINKQIKEDYSEELLDMIPDSEVSAIIAENFAEEYREYLYIMCIEDTPDTMKRFILDNLAFNIKVTLELLGL